MTDDTCGHPTANDTPCQHPACRPDDKCWIHTDHNPTPGGQPTKLTDDRTQTITSAIAEGKTIADAARMCGINRVTVYNWLERGESEDDGPYHEFFNDVERARGHRGDYYHSLALELAIEDGDHRFIMSLLKTMEPEVWGDTDTGVNADRNRVINLPESVTKEWQRKPHQR